MKKHKLTFKTVYLTGLGLLVLLTAAAVFYVYRLLGQYEASQPERQVRQAVEALAAQAADGTLPEAYGLSRPEPGPYEAGRDVLEEYLELYADQDALTIARSAGSVQGDTVEYQVSRGGAVLARVGLRAEGEPVTKLAVLTMRPWAVDYVRPVLEAQDYTLTVPAAFDVRLNGTALEGEAGANGESTYAVSGLYLPPDFSVTDSTGTEAAYTVHNGKVLVEYVNYTLTLPDALTVRVDGGLWPGEDQGEDRVRYEIALLNQPAVTIADCYGNEVSYEGGSELPLTSCTVTAAADVVVEVDGAPVPGEAVTELENPDYQHFAGYVSDLPRLRRCSVAVLREDAVITVTDGRGETVTLTGDGSAYDFTEPAGADAVPAEVSAEIDVLRTAQNWSLFMSNDLAFSRVADTLIPGSYQYEVAQKYATGTDITFTSRHTLDDPAFTENSVSNFVWITEDCFSVDIRFVKHMRLWYGAAVDDPMNDRFYFVRYDATDDGVDNPVWKLASMKEILDDGS